jgi:iron complex outermembrane recepter protein
MNSAGKFMRRVCVGFAALLVPWCVWAQSAAPVPTAKPATSLPTISVPVPKQKPPRSAQPKRPPAKRAAPAPVHVRAPPVRERAPAPAPPPEVPAPVDGNDTIGTSPVPGSEIPREKIPANAHVMPGADFEHTRAPDLLAAIGQRLPGVSIGDQSGNEFQRDVSYRGFTASPVIGTPQGLAVYQNGVRINEVFGDTVNWDFIPESAIGRLALVPNNPVYGLNALGGAISIQMKNGFTYHGSEADVRGGSYGRIGATVQAGGQNGDVAAYFAADALNDAGWRDQSPSRLRRIFADLGTRGDGGEFHVSFTGADNFFGATAATPVQLLAQRWSSIYTVPQTTENSLAFLIASASLKPTDTLALQGLVYFRGFWQRHVDGNGTDAQNDGCPDPTFLCFPDLMGNLTNLIGGNGQPVPAAGPLAAPNVLGEIDRTSTATNGYGGSLQATITEKAFGRDNHLVVGTSLDHGHVQFGSAAELGVMNADQFPFVTGTGVIINQPSGDVAPVSLRADTTYIGAYATDTLDLTSRLSLTAGGRFNVALIKLTDEFGGPLSGNDQFMRFNPVVGATYKVLPNVTVYGGYSEANRAPTPLELACADPLRPCLIDTFLVGDPPLKQVVAHTYEAGIRGKADFRSYGYGQATWSLGAFHTQSDDDIINVASQLPNHGFFQNAGTTLRQGIEANVTYQQARWSTYANYSYVDATFQSVLLLSSPFNPAADPATGRILVTPGDHIPAVPRDRFKAGADYSVTDAWKIGADLNVVGSQYLMGDQSNQNPQVPTYWTVNLNTSYQLDKNVEVFGLVRNLFNRHYYASGTFFQTDSFPYLNLTDPRTFVPGMPLALYAGLRARW